MKWIRPRKTPDQNQESGQAKKTEIIYKVKKVFDIISTFILLNNMDLFYDSRPSVTGPFGTGSGFRKKRTRILVSQKNRIGSGSATEQIDR